MPLKRPNQQQVSLERQPHSVRFSLLVSPLAMMGNPPAHFPQELELGQEQFAVEVQVYLSLSTERLDVLMDADSWHQDVA